MTTRRGSARGGSSGSSGCGAGSKGSGKGVKGSGKGPQRWEPPLRSLFEIPMTMFDGTAMREDAAHRPLQGAWAHSGAGGAGVCV